MRVEAWGWVVTALAFFALQGVDFGLGFFVCSHFALQKPLGQRDFFSHAGGGEQIGVTQFVGVSAEVAHFDPAFFDQGLEAEVDAADVDADFFDQCALAYARLVLQQLARPEKGVVVGGFAAGGHVDLK